MRAEERGMGRAWFEISGLEAARQARRVREKRYRSMVVSVYEMRMSRCRREGSKGNNKATVSA